MNTPETAKTVLDDRNEDTHPNIPDTIVIEGSKVRLESFPLEDEAPQDKTFVSIFNDPKTMEHLKSFSPEPQGWTLKSSMERRQRFVKAQKNNEAVSFNILEKSSNEIAGLCGIQKIDWKHRFCESGIILHHPFWGKGLGTESFYLLWQYAFEQLHIHRIEFLTISTNRAMRGLFQKFGITQEGVKRSFLREGNGWSDWILYAILEDEWPKVKMEMRKKLDQQQQHSSGSDGEPLKKKQKR